MGLGGVRSTKRGDVEPFFLGPQIFKADQILIQLEKNLLKMRIVDFPVKKGWFALKMSCSLGSVGFM